MRLTCLALGVLLLATSASATDVRLTVKTDGTKVIYNVGGPRGGSGEDLNWLARRHDRHSQYDPLIEKYASKYGVDATLVRAVIQVESDFNPLCVSNKGARGLMQLMPDTARRFGVTKVHDPEQNIHGGIRYLSYLTRLFNDDLSRALAAYNAGENAVLKYGGIPPYDETSEYVRRALTVYNGRPYGEATSFAAKRGGTKLKGGFGAGLVSPVAVILLPGVKFIGQH